METAESIINDALQEILVQASEQPIQPVDFQIARRYLNRMMATFPFNGLGFAVVTEPKDLITIQSGAIEGVVFNLAKRMLASYDMPLTAELQLSASDGLKEIRRLVRNSQFTSHPSTLPIGSGNEGGRTFSRDHFYHGEEAEILTEQNGSILVEDNANE